MEELGYNAYIEVIQAITNDEAWAVETFGKTISMSSYPDEILLRLLMLTDKGRTQTDWNLIPVRNDYVAIDWRIYQVDPGPSQLCKTIHMIERETVPGGTYLKELIDAIQGPGDAKVFHFWWDNIDPVVRQEAQMVTTMALI